MWLPQLSRLRRIERIVTAVERVGRAS